MNLLQKIKKVINKEYISIEIWDETFKAKRIRPYIKSIINRIQMENPSLEILSVKKTPFLTDFGRFPWEVCTGYIIKTSTNVDVFSLKKTCMNLEIRNGNRIADIDIYFYGKKISRGIWMYKG